MKTIIVKVAGAAGENVHVDPRLTKLSIEAWEAGEWADLVKRMDARKARDERAGGTP